MSLLRSFYLALIGLLAISADGWAASRASDGPPSTEPTHVTIYMDSLEIQGFMELYGLTPKVELYLKVLGQKTSSPDSAKQFIGYFSLDDLRLGVEDEDIGFEENVIKVPLSLISLRMKLHRLEGVRLYLELVESSVFGSLEGQEEKAENCKAAFNCVLNYKKHEQKIF